MRVLVVGPDGVDSSERSCARGLAELGHEAEVVDLRRHMGVPRAISRSYLLTALAEGLLRATVREPYHFAQRHLLERAKTFRADLVLVVQLTWVLPETVVALRDRGVRCVGWFPDAFTSFGRGTFLLAPWDALFFQDRFIVERLRKTLSADYVHHLAQCFDPQVHRPLPLGADDERRLCADVATFGNYYPYRARLIEPLLDGSFDVKLWGSRPPRWLRHPVHRFWAGREVTGDDKCRAMRACRIALNTNHYAGIGDVNKRTFELAGIGAFQLTDEREALRSYLEPGVEVATFTGRADLADKVRYYLARPEERARIAAAGCARAHREHTFVHRLRVLLGTIGLTP
ncbi:MAG: glycosyltransferase [Polyangia bacterium]